MGAGGAGQEKEGGPKEYIGIHTADSLCYTAETNTTLQSNYIPIRKKEVAEARKTLTDSLWSGVLGNYQEKMDKCDYPNF